MFAQEPVVNDSIYIKHKLRPNPHIFTVKRQELGVDISAFIKNFLPFNTTQLLTSNTSFANFLITYKSIDSKGWAFRSGYNLSARSAEGEQFPIGTRRLTVGTRLGFEKQRYFGKRHILYSGTDFSFEYAVDYAQEPLSGASDKTEVITYGLSWVGGYNFRAAEWLSVGTEMSLGAMRSDIIETNTDPGFPSGNNKSRSFENNIMINLPISIFVNFIF
ncbi:MAG: hypothetical protein M0D57_13410 [Sphingobacteriales bacterium JAD_PAG50586_3]|nr:MAG: hypothetical protein M0D57_13410 [Sphingobacteriales bacterium JAD_PAG50586_3]